MATGKVHMNRALNRFLDVVDRVSDRSGRIVCYLIFIIMTITALDVVARYVFNHPLLWGWMLNRILFGVFILFAGVYTLSRGEHIRIEILYDHFPPRLKKTARLIALAALLLFLGVLAWQSSWMGWNSLMMKERAPGAFRIPLYPFKLLIPAVVFLFLLEGVSRFLRHDD